MRRNAFIEHLTFALSGAPPQTQTKGASLHGAAALERAVRWRLLILLARRAHGFQFSEHSMRRVQICAQDDHTEHDHSRLTLHCNAEPPGKLIEERTNKQRTHYHQSKALNGQEGGFPVLHVIAI